MTIDSINANFDLLYDNAISEGAPGLDMFEKSMFLTLAYRKLVSELADLYESDEKVRKALTHLTNNYKVDYDSAAVSSYQSSIIGRYSWLFPAPPNVWRIWEERMFISETSSIEVIPKTHDEYNKQFLNPFKKPNADKAWRMDISSNGAELIEIITTHTPTAYQARYLKKPAPILLENLDTAIDGITDQTTFIELGTEFHEDIVKRAVMLAEATYKRSQQSAGQ
jgi:hypothetical protein